jgi:hypothetical protein
MKLKTMSRRESRVETHCSRRTGDAALPVVRGASASTLWYCVPGTAILENGPRIAEA